MWYKLLCGTGLVVLIIFGGALTASAEEWTQTTFPLGTGTFTNTSPANLDGDIVLDSFPVSASASGDSHTLAIMTDGTLWAWGSNNTGQLGLGSSDSDPHPNPVQVGTDTNWARAAAGDAFTIALKTDGTLWAWGSNSYGRLGLGGGLDRDSPTQVATATNWAAIALGEAHAIGLKTDGTLWAWGLNNSGQLGLGDYINCDSPTQVETDTDWKTIATGLDHTLAIKTDGTLWTWGKNDQGQLGLGDYTNRNSPTKVGSVTNWQAIAGGEQHTLALKTDGTLWAWGYNGKGQLGLGHTNTPVTPTTQVGSATDWQTIASGYDHTIALKTDGTLWSCGWNWYGQLGLGDSSGGTDRSSLTQVGTGTDWQTIPGGFYHTIAIKSDGTLWGWGLNGSGQLGLGDTTTRTSPTKNTGLTVYVTSGTYVSDPITPTDVIAWGVLTFMTNTPVSTTLTVDVLDISNNVITSNVASGADLSTSVDAATYPQIKLRANLSTTDDTQTPTLSDWSVNYNVVIPAVDDYVWVANLNSNSVTRVKKSDSTTTTIAVGTNPWGVAVDEAYVWVVNCNSHNVTRITKSDLITTTIAVGTSPRGVAVDGTYVWVANWGSHNITRIKKSDLSTTTTPMYSVGGQNPYGTAVDEMYVWVAVIGSDKVTRFKKSDLSTTNIAVGSMPLGIAVDDTCVWVANYASENVTRILKSDLSQTTIAVGTGPWGIAVDETHVWVATYIANPPDDNLIRIKKSDLTTTTIGGLKDPHGVSVDEIYVWVANYTTGNNVTRIKKSDLSIISMAWANGSESLGDMTGYAYDFFFTARGANLVISAGANNPAASNELDDTLKLPMLQVNLAVPSGYEDVQVNSVKLTASGSANDKDDISAVWLVLDDNSNGIPDIGETVLAGPTTYSSDNGTLTLSLSTPRVITVTNTENWLVVYNLNGKASLGETLAVSIDSNTAISAVGVSTGFTITPSGAPVQGNTKTISDVTASVTSGTAPLQVEFASQFGTGGTVVQYEWDFDYDGVTFRPDFFSNLTGDIRFTYEIEDTYTARLRITYADGTVIIRDITIEVSPESNAPTTIEVSALTTIGPAPLTVTFTVTAEPGTGKIEAYLWDFDGDGVIDFTSTTTNTATYTYTQADAYTVVVTVQNSEGLMAESILTDFITVQAVLIPPTANIISPAGSTTIDLGENISFVGEGITKEGGSIVKYEWDFDGDGSFDLGGPNITSTNYTYLKTGEFTVKFRVTEEPSGLTGENTVMITVNPSPTPRVAIKQPGVPVKDKDGLRRTVNGKITVKAISVPVPLTETLDLRYRLVGGTLSDTLEDVPLEPSHSDWQTTALTKSTFVTSDAGAQGFITTLDTTGLADENWHEIIAVANYNSGDGTYDSWNADQTKKRVFIYIDNDTPELDEDETRLKTQVESGRNNQVSKGNQVSVIIPYEGVTTDTDLTLSIPGSVPPSGGLSFTNNYRGVVLSGGVALQKPARMSITYADANNDGVVDGTTIPESTLIMYRYDAADGKWEPLSGQIIESDNNTISAITSGFSTFGTTGTPKAPEGGGDITGSSGSTVGKDWYQCFIATAVYGTPLAKDVCILREFRDRYLMTHLPGRGVVSAYYYLSPPIARVIAHNETLRGLTRLSLTPVVLLARFMVYSHLIQKIIILGLLIALFVLVIRRKPTYYKH